MISRCRLRRGEDRLQFLDLRPQLGGLVDDLLTLEGGQPAKLHVQDGGGLDLRQLEPLHQLAPGDIGRLRVADEADDLVEVVERDQQAVQHVQPLAGLAELVAGTADDDFDLVLDVVADHLVQPQRARHAVDDRQHVRRRTCPGAGCACTGC